MIKVTADAAKQIQIARSQSGADGLSLRLAAEKQEDGSLHYMMGFDGTKDADIQVVSEGVEILVEPQYQELLDGTTIDYVELESGDFRFIFMNPNDANFQPGEKA